mmetsp:Transcript_6156/g.18189  ORF Transcript_6156/g.18189 Transcript_6156/m.18189 type:complete len:134 (+) Transcript_6156:206-607(+)
MGSQGKQSELQAKVNAMVSTIDSSTLRPMKKASFLAMAKCCDLDSPEAYQQCLARASAPEQRASQIMQVELNDFQDRLQRAVRGCQDEVKDKGVRDQNRAQNMFSNCVDNALTKHIGMVPGVQKRIEAAIKGK